MKFKNCRLDEAYKFFGDKKIIFFGKGRWIKNVEFTALEALKDRYECVVDNNPTGEVEISGKRLPVHSPDFLIDLKNVIVILTSPIYMYDMFIQLEEMKLNDSIECYAFPFMQLISDPKNGEIIEYRDIKEQYIPKIIHSFWFSGDSKPKTYQKCRDTWDIHLNDYKIIEWNMDNYDWHKNCFLERAIECQAWAFATDYARLDVLNEYGGIYLDMDVEVIKNFDDLLGNEGIFAFSNNVSVDLAVLGAKRENKIIKQLLKLYENVELPKEKKYFSDFFQPSFIRKTLVENGIEMNGKMQKVDGGTVFPREFFMPQDFILFEQAIITDNTYCIHYDNFGWSNDKDNKREKKIRDNRKLWELLKQKS